MATVTDTRLREAERRFEASGSADDEGALLRERLRVGLIPRAHVDLAARLGDPAARAAVPDRSPIELPTRATLHEGGSARPAWAAALQLRHPEALLRFLVAALRGGGVAMPDGLELLELTLVLDTRDWSPRRRYDAGEGRTWQSHALHQLYLWGSSEGGGGALLVRDALSDLLPGDSALQRGVEAAKREVADWLLGRRDALRERVEARRSPTRPG